MTRKRRSQRDLIEQEIELVPNPGAFIPDRACFSFVSDLDEITAKVAKRVSSDPHPDLGARLWRAQGLRTVNAKKSKYYDAALSNFERAKRCFEQAGLDDEWNKTVRHSSRRPPAQEQLHAGIRTSGRRNGAKRRSLDRAEARWSAKERNTR